MHVTLCVDALQPQLSGIGRYTWELCKALPASDSISSLHYYRNHRLVDRPAELLENPHYRSRWHRRPLGWIGRLRASNAFRSTLVHGTNYFLPAEVEHGVISVHDLSVFRYPQTHPIDRVRSFERSFASSLTRAAHVITDSETIRRELIDELSLPDDKVTAVALGVDRNFRPMDQAAIAPALAQRGLEPGGYGLSVAAFEPRKKITELIRAWKRLPTRLREGYRLVLAGGSGWRNDELHEEIAKAEAEGWLKHLGFVDDGLLPQLYAGARLFVYPSIYEGFGLPPVEAMASGTPVIVSDRSCLPEVCGDAARYIDPDNSEAFTAAIQEGLRDERWRLGAIERGLARAALYSWERCVANTVTIYRSVWGQLV